MLFYHGIAPYTNTAMIAPTIGPNNGTIAYPQPESHLPSIGNNACASLGPISRAGLIAYPVKPPNDIPTETIIPNTNMLPSPISPAPATLLIPLIANTKIKVPIISLKKFKGLSSIDGAVQNTPLFVGPSSVASN